MATVMVPSWAARIPPSFISVGETSVDKTYADGEKMGRIGVSVGVYIGYMTYDSAKG